MNLLLAAAGALVIALAGAGGLRFVWPAIRGIPRAVRLALGFCVGGWVITIAFFGAYLGSIAFSRWLLLTPLALFGVIGLVALRPGALKQPRFSLAAFLGLTLV